jgi:hypothetical protein
LHTRIDERDRYTALIEEMVPAGRAVLALGCGTSAGGTTLLRAIRAALSP